MFKIFQTLTIKLTPRLIFALIMAGLGISGFSVIAVQAVNISDNKIVFNFKFFDESMAKNGNDNAEINEKIEEITNKFTELNESVKKIHQQQNANGKNAPMEKLAATTENDNVINFINNNETTEAIINNQQNKNCDAILLKNCVKYSKNNYDPLAPASINSR